MADTSIQSQLPPCTWEAKGKSKVVLPMTHIQGRGGNALVGHKRVHQNGKRYDDMGEVGDGFTLTLKWFDGMKVPGISEHPWPGDVIKVIDSFRSHDIGILTLPSRGPKRCRAETWTWDEPGIDDRVDYVVASVVFVEDNGDDQGLNSFQQPSPRAAAGPAANEAVDLCTEHGVWSDDVGSLEQLAGEIEALASAPADMASGLADKAADLEARVDRIEAAFTRSTEALIAPTGPLLLAPGAAPVILSLYALRDLAQRAQRAAGAKRTTETFPTPANLFALAPARGIPLDRLLAANTHIEHLDRVPPGVPVFFPSP